MKVNEMTVLEEGWVVKETEKAIQFKVPAYFLKYDKNGCDYDTIINLSIWSPKSLLQKGKEGYEVPVWFLNKKLNEACEYCMISGTFLQLAYTQE